MFYHAVLISFQLETSEKDRERVFQLLRDLGKRTSQEYGVTYWSVERNLDTRPRAIVGGRTIDVVEVGIFTSEENFKRWRTSPEHLEVAQEMSAVMDWVIGDVNWPQNLV
jgi:hypothetical protein